MQSQEMKMGIGLLRFAVLVFLALLLGSQALWATEQSWNLRLKEEGITVYTRKVEGSPILAFQADMVVDAPLDKVLRLFEDVGKIPLWYYQCVHAEILGADPEGAYILYVIMDLPWPVATRDAVFRQDRVIAPSSGVVTYSATALPDRLPVEKGKVRVRALNSVWKFTPLEGGWTGIHMEQHSDPGGIIPAFLVNKLVVDIPFNTLRNMRRMILEESRK